ncbi:MAG: hypothetical protein M0C28_20155 [Candidatus Moduliflexus flocculans]|nr:hypothetical protein [Candidatus Moduliflexus flocculans]
MLKIAAAVLLAALLVMFRGQGGNGQMTWLQTSWWGILGMIGWCYLAGALLFLASRGDRAVLAGAVGLTTALYIGSRHGVLDFLGPINGFIDVGSLFGSHAAVVTAGMLAGTLFLPGMEETGPRVRVRFLAILGSALLLAGFVLRPLHGFSKIRGTESYALATAGICGLAFLLFTPSSTSSRRRKPRASSSPPAGTRSWPISCRGSSAAPRRSSADCCPSTSDGSSGRSTGREDSRACSTPPR